MITVKDKDTLNAMVNSKTNKSFYVGDDFLKDVRKMLGEMDESSEQSSNMPSVKNQNIFDNGELFHPINSSKTLFISDYCLADKCDICEDIAAYLKDYQGIETLTVDMPYIFQDELGLSFPVFSYSREKGYEFTGNVYNLEDRQIRSITELDKKVSSECLFAYKYYDRNGDLQWDQMNVPDIDLRKIFLDSTMDTINDRLAKMDPKIRLYDPSKNMEEDTEIEWTF